MKRTLYIIPAIILVVLLSGCTEDPIIVSHGRQPQDTLKTATVVPAVSSFLEINKTTRRSLPSGYVAYSDLDPTPIPNNTTIGLLFAQSGSSAPAVQEVTMDKSTRRWSGTLSFDASYYYIYGFMPSNLVKTGSAMSTDATITPYDGATYESGAIMTIRNLDALTTADVCVIVGVAKGTADDDIKIADTKLGHFGFQGTVSSESSDNKMYLLLKHVYTGLHFKCHIDGDYAKLRTIKIKNMTLRTADKISTKINLDVTLEAHHNSEESIDPVKKITYTSTTDVEAEKDYATKQLFPRDGYAETEFTVPTDAPESFLGCFAPSKCTSFVLTTVYDVYDKQGNLIRKDQTAENTLNQSTLKGISSVKAGEIYTIDLKIQPTYLYMLSDPDLDNPTIVIK